MSVTPTENRASFWTQPATILDISKFLLPVIVGVSIWASSVEVRQAKTDSKFEQITQTLAAQNETLKSVQEVLKSLNDTKDERGQRTARLEAKTDIVMAQQMQMQQILQQIMQQKGSSK